MKKLSFVAFLGLITLSANISAQTLWLIQTPQTVMELKTNSKFQEDIIRAFAERSQRADSAEEVCIAGSFDAYYEKFLTEELECPGIKHTGSENQMTFNAVCKDATVSGSITKVGEGHWEGPLNMTSVDESATVKLKGKIIAKSTSKACVIKN